MKSDWNKSHYDPVPWYRTQKFWNGASTLCLAGGVAGLITAVGLSRLNKKMTAPTALGGLSLLTLSWVAKRKVLYKDDPVYKLAQKRLRVIEEISSIVKKPDAPILTFDDTITRCQRDKDGNTPLHLAVRSGFMEAVEIALDSGISPNVMNDQGFTPMHEAIKANATPEENAIALKLLSSGLNPNQSDAYGHHYLAYARALDNPILFQTLRKQFHVHPSYQRFLMGMAIVKNQEAVVDFLIRQGVDVNRIRSQIDDESGEVTYTEHPLRNAYDCRNYNMCEKLCEAGANPHIRHNDIFSTLEKSQVEKQGHFVNLFKQYAKGKTTSPESDLFKAVDAKDIEKTKRLIKEGADVNEPVPFNGGTPLLQALVDKNMVLVKCLVEQGKADLDAADHRGISPLMKAMSVEFEEGAVYLIKKGAKVEGIHGLTDIPPIMFALARDLPKVVKALLDRGATPHVRGETPTSSAFGIALSHENPNCTNVLHQHGVDWLEPMDITGCDVFDFFQETQLPHLAKLVTNNNLSGVAEYSFAAPLLSHLARGQLEQESSKEQFQKQLKAAQALITQLSQLFPKEDEYKNDVLAELFVMLLYRRKKMVKSEDYIPKLAEVFQRLKNKNDVKILCFYLGQIESLDATQFTNFLGTSREWHRKLNTLTKEQFATLKSNDQVNILHYAKLFRVRRAVHLCDDVITTPKKFTNEIVSKALEARTQIGISMEEKLRENTLKLVDSHPAKTLKAVQALAPYSGLKNVILKQLKQAESIDTQCELVLLLGNFTDPSGIVEPIINLSTNTKDPKLLRHCGLTLSQLNDKKALLRAQQIVQSDVWGPWDEREPTFYRVIYWEKYLEAPKTHHNRLHVMARINERLAKVEKKHKMAEQVYRAYTSWPRGYPMIHQFKKAVADIPDESRLITPLIVYPHKRAILRGLSATKGKINSHAFLPDMLLKGIWAADLEQLPTFENNHWTRYGQLFFTHAWKYIKDDYCDENGSLIQINSDYINERMLRGRGRYEMESECLSSTLYDAVPWKAVIAVWTPKQALDFVAGGLAEKTRKMMDGLLSTYQKKITFYQGTTVADMIEKSPMKHLVTDADVAKESTIHFIMRKMVMGTKFKLHICSFSEEIHNFSAKQFGELLQKEAVPLYQKPFGNYTLYGTEYQPWISPRGKPHLDTVPRWIHGPLHAVMVGGILSRALMGIYEELGQPVANPRDLMLAGVFHDVARKDEGKDYWDADSGRMLSKYLIRKEYPAGYAHHLGSHIEHKHKRETIEQKIIDGADCLHILRLGQFAKTPLQFSTEMERGKFNTSELPLIKEKGKGALELVREVHHLSQMLENPKVKLPLETQSKNLYVDLLCLIQGLKQDYPILIRYLKDDMKELKPSDVVKKISYSFQN